MLIVGVIARSPGMGLIARNYSARPDWNGQTFFEPLDDRPVELTLRANVPIEGRLLSQIGKPVAGASIALATLGGGQLPVPDRFFLRAPGDSDGRPVRAPYWPSSVVTDAQGRFRIDGLFGKGGCRDRDHS